MSQDIVVKPYANVIPFKSSASIIPFQVSLSNNIYFILLLATFIAIGILIVVNKVKVFITQFRKKLASTYQPQSLSNISNNDNITDKYYKLEETIAEMEMKIETLEIAIKKKSSNTIDAKINCLATNLINVCKILGPILSEANPSNRNLQLKIREVVTEEMPKDIIKNVGINYSIKEIEYPSFPDGGPRGWRYQQYKFDGASCWQ